MHLSEAVLLGDLIRTRDAGCYLRWPADEVGPCGCAIGGAVMAVRSGITRQDIAAGYDTNGYSLAEAIWPWLERRIACSDGHIRTYDTIISIQFYEVVEGKRTLESLADYIRSVEPSCGECCRFDCTCVQKMDEPTTTLQTVMQF